MLPDSSNTGAAKALTPGTDRLKPARSRVTQAHHCAMAHGDMDQVGRFFNPHNRRPPVSPHGQSDGVAKLHRQRAKPIVTADFVLHNQTQFVELVKIKNQ